MSTSSNGSTAGFRREVALIPLVGLIFFNVSGGAYGLEPVFSLSGPGVALLVIAVVPLLYGIPIAAITTELATAIPAEGGTYEWAKQGLGNFVAFQAGVLRWLSSWVDMAIYPVLFASYLGVLLTPVGASDLVFFEFGPFKAGLPWLIGVVCVIVPLALLNLRSAEIVGKSAVLLGVIALAPLAVLSILGIIRLFNDDTNPFVPFAAPETSALTAFGAGLAVVMWSYGGFDRVGLIAGEIKDPARAIPKAMLVAMVVIVASYLLPPIGALAAGDWSTWDVGSFGVAAGLIGGRWLEVLVTVGGMACCVGL